VHVLRAWGDAGGEAVSEDGVLCDLCARVLPEDETQTCADCGAVYCDDCTVQHLNDCPEDDEEKP
jgi:hypothetical protein